jgi:hypothetical protein
LRLSLGFCASAGNGFHLLTFQRRDPRLLFQPSALNFEASFGFLAHTRRFFLQLNALTGCRLLLSKALLFFNKTQLKALGLLALLDALNLNLGLGFTRLGDLPCIELLRANLLLHLQIAQARFFFLLMTVGRLQILP